MKIKVGVSARHVHLTTDDVKTLFGEGYNLTKKANLSQEGQYSCNEQVVLKGTKGSIERVRVLGPERNKTQVEISKTDSFMLGIKTPVKKSGDLDDASEITIIGPKGEVTKKAAIIAARHVHMSSLEAKEFGVKDKEVVTLVVNGPKGGILDNVHVRINDNFHLEAHLDTDDANAFFIENTQEVELKKK